MRVLLIAALLGGCSISALEYGSAPTECDAGQPAESDAGAYVDAGRPMSKRLILAPLGLITQPNKYGQYPPGAMAVATNVALRDPGVLSSMPALTTLRANALASGYRARMLSSGAAYQLVVGDNAGTWSVKWVDGSGATAITSPSAFSHTFGTGIAPVARQRSRTILGTSNGPIVMDSETDSTARVAGFGRPYVYGHATSAGTAFPDNYQVRYIACLRRIHSDKYETNGPFSAGLLIPNDSGSAVKRTVGVMLESNIGVVAGDLVELYRTKNTAIGVDPGKTFYLVKAQSVTSTDVTNFSISIADAVADDDLGPEAYVNPAQEGVNKQKEPPPIARDIVVHKGYALYLGTTRPAALAGFLSGSWSGDTASTLSAAERLNGIGRRSLVGDRTNLSPTITNISAADIVGLAIGQYFTGTGIPASTTITAVGATTVTLSANATSTAAGASFTSLDSMTIAGVKIFASDLDTFRLSVSLPSLAVPPYGFTSFFFAADRDRIPVTSGDTVPGLEFAISRQFAHEGSFTIQASNGGNFSPKIATYSESAQTVAVDQKLNRVMWSELEQPEAVPTLNSFPVGSGELYRGVSVGGVVLVFASDGLWQISGDGQNGWQTNHLDPTLILAARGAVAVMDGKAWAYTNRGLVSITENGAVTEHSTGRIAQAAQSAEFAGSNYADTWTVKLACDELHHRVFVTLDGGNVYTVYDARADGFTTFANPLDRDDALDYSKALNSLVFANNTSGGPSVEYFLADNSNTRLDGAVVQFQPFTGDDNPSVQKEWISVEYQFEGFTQSAGAITPSFSGTSYTTRTIPMSTAKSRVLVSVPRNAPAISPEIEPGFSITTGDTTNPWSLRMIAIEVVPATEEGVPR